MKILSRKTTWEDGTVTDGPRPAPKPMGLGDAVAAIANPIARAIDAVAGTKIYGCGGCAKRREALNNLAPDIGLTKRPEPDTST